MEVVPASRGHIEQLLARPLRQADVDEWVLGSSRPVPQLLREVDVNQGVVRALLNDRGECTCMWGVCPSAFGPNFPGTVWLLASQEAELHGRCIHRMWKTEVLLLHSVSRNLQALAYANNPAHHVWLQAVGFKPVSGHLIGPGAIPFILFERILTDV